MKTKSNNSNDRVSSQQVKNLQLESLYLRETRTRIQAWKRYQNEISQQHYNWPPPINGKTYNKREESIYNINTHDYNSNSWFDRRLYKNDLIKATQRRHRLLDSNKPSPEKKTKLDNEILQLKQKIETFQLNDVCSESMYPIQPSVRYLLYNGTSKELEGRVNYLNQRKLYAPDEKYYQPLCTSWDITWNLKDLYDSFIYKY
ncbi:unnamed protein product [Adineta steineri]|uniref:Sperm microtubule inner protein 1 C-terminal domain-containing protein n=1 Tax=Adineta steineri TaxID=433720 RepID=A0A815J2Y9_9BILA|nr:unnamed protein product [Adineta steineri]